MPFKQLFELVAGRVRGVFLGPQASKITFQVLGVFWGDEVVFIQKRHDGTPRAFPGFLAPTLDARLQQFIDLGLNAVRNLLGPEILNCAINLY